jgi:hypothetical protein
MPKVPRALLPRLDKKKVEVCKAGAAIEWVDGNLRVSAAESAPYAADTRLSWAVAVARQERESA